MTRKSVTVEIFPFAELSKDVQDKLIQRDLSDNYGFASSAYEEERAFIDENFGEALRKQGFENAFLLYTGFSSQGDGASFNADVNNDVFFTKEVKQDILKQYKKLTPSLLQKVIDTTIFEIKRDEYSPYFHENTMEVLFENNYGGDDWEWVEDCAYDVGKYIEKKAREQAKVYYKQLEEAYYDYYNADYIRECFIEDGGYYGLDGYKYIEF